MGARCPLRGEEGHGSWYLSLELPAAPDGRRRRIRRGGFPSWDNAETALARLQMPSPGDPGSPPLTVGQWLERWLVSRAAPRNSTLRGYAAHVRLYELPPARRPKAVVWTTERITEWQRTGIRPSVAV